jgi:glucosamine-6-phosphate deaminase
MQICLHPTAAAATTAAADLLASWITQLDTRTIMVAGGHSPLELYADIARRQLALSHLHVFTLDEYLGVSPTDPRTCTNLLRRAVVEAWNVPHSQFTPVSSLETDALGSLQQQQDRLHHLGGLDVAVLGLGQNGHLGCNEPGSPADSPHRLVDLEPSSIEANRQWFGGDCAPCRGATNGLQTLLHARRVLVLAFGPHKATPVRAMVTAPPGPHCPASFLQKHREAWLFLDPAAARLGGPCQPQ